MHCKNMTFKAVKVVGARDQDIEYVKEMRVYDKIPRNHAIRNGWNIIKTRWIVMNRGDDDNPNYRSMSVGSEFGN